MALSDSEYFQQLPALTPEMLSSLASGQELPLLLIEYTPSGVGVVFPLHYCHGRLACPASGLEDAVAIGTARLAGCGEPKDVRILFAGPLETAILRGLPFEGQVKIGQLEHGSLTEFLASIDQ